MQIPLRAGVDQPGNDLTLPVQHTASAQSVSQYSERERERERARKERKRERRRERERESARGRDESDARDGKRTTRD